ncbi:MAG: recombination mediator RecR [Clostridiales bacterium]|uniref:Recombination protein RecR n=1 Tax=Peptococcus niger TaxID=2741 RepID=A0A1G6ZPR3_PEPNI|nr:recombination mediator RecR [Peptococcus niger]MBS5915381.1 recombination mediator RecR [Clostridiales bacterium]MDU5952070.1 recombination mediator RecR [Clostridiales bacterium]SDE04207.1 DNA replication and repair protein RecR [Peptococcus niger]
MAKLNDALQDLIDALARLPGIGRKSAMRLAFHILDAPPEEAEALARAIRVARHTIGHCPRCGNLTDGDLCRICADSSRDIGQICVVEEVRDIAAIERTGAFKGRYHVLGGRLSPMDGIGPEDLRIDALKDRIRAEQVEEVILATNPSVEGETTALFLIDELRPLKVRLTRIARGLPIGGDIKFADDMTLARALDGRVDV